MVLQVINSAQDFKVLTAVYLLADKCQQTSQERAVGSLGKLLRPAIPILKNTYYKLSVKSQTASGFEDMKESHLV